VATEEEVARFYRDDYRRLYKGTITPKPRHVYRAINAALDRYQAVSACFEPQGAHLDLGAGGGEYVYLLKKKGFRVEGIEPSTGYAFHAKPISGSTSTSAPSRPSTCPPRATT
jgi:hypothetical protein